MPSSRCKTLAAAMSMSASYASGTYPTHNESSGAGNSSPPPTNPPTPTYTHLLHPQSTMHHHAPPSMLPCWISHRRSSIQDIASSQYRVCLAGASCWLRLCAVHLHPRAEKHSSCVSGCTSQCVHLFQEAIFFRAPTESHVEHFPYNPSSAQFLGGSYDIAGSPQHGFWHSRAGARRWQWAMAG